MSRVRFIGGIAVVGLVCVLGCQPNDRQMTSSARPGMQDGMMKEGMMKDGMMKDGKK